MNDVMRQLKDLRDIKPRAEWVKDTRAILLSQIRGQESLESARVSGIRYMDVLKVVFGYKILAPIVRPVSAAVLAIIVALTGGVAGVRAAKNSTPGDLLYPVKLTSENLQVGLASAPSKKAELYLNFAEERVKEIEKIKAAANGSRSMKIDSAASNLKDKLQKATEQLNAVRATEPEKAVELAKSVNAKVEAISGKLSVIEKDLKVTNESSDAVSSAQAAARNTEIGAVEVIIEKSATGTTGSELKDIIGNKIDSMTQDIRDSKTEMDSAVEVIIAEQKLQEAGKLLNEGDLDSAVSRMKESVEAANPVDVIVQ